jgi:hypothetical protein
MRENRPYGSEGGESQTLPDPYHMWTAPCLQGVMRLLSVADDMSGLRSTRVVRFWSRSKGDGDGSDGVAAGPQDEEVSGCFGAL